MPHHRDEIARRLSPILGRNLAFAWRDQLLPLFHDLYPDVERLRERRHLLCNALQAVEKDGLIQSQTVGALITPLAGSTPVFSWSRGEPQPDFDRETPRLRARYPETGVYREIRLYFATGRTAEIMEEPVHPYRTIIREKLQAEIKRNAEFQLSECLNHYEVRELLGDTFVTCRLNIANIFFHHILNSPCQWTAYLELGETSPIPDYPHAVRTDGGRKIAVLFAGSLGPKILRSVHMNLSVAYDGYECW